MRFMVIVKANKDSEAGVMPTEALLTRVQKARASNSLVEKRP